MTIQYRIENLDCPSCAAKIENAVNRIPGVETASIDFISRVIHIRASDNAASLKTVQNAIGAVDSVVSVIDEGGKVLSRDNGDEKRGGAVREFQVMGLAMILFGFVLFVEYYAKEPMILNAGLAVGIIAWLLSGAGVIKKAVGTLFRGRFFDENVLMMIATLGAFYIGAVSEAVGVMIFYRTGELLQNLAVGRSKKAITSLLATRPDTANICEGNGTKQVPARELKPGDMIMVRPGERVPADGQVVSGQSFLDTAALTGEPVPKNVHEGESVLAGMINRDGLLTVSVTRPFSESTISKMIALVESSGAKKAKTERFITTFAGYYTPVVVLGAAAIAIVPPLFVPGALFSDWLYRALVLLVISCPCALMISIPLGYFGGIGRASKMGILVKGAEFIDTLSNLKTVVFDKTGTLTLGVFTVKNIMASNGFSKNDVLKYAAAAERHSNHPIAKSIIAAAVDRGFTIDSGQVGNVDDYEELPGKGVRTFVDGQRVIAGTRKFLESQGIDVAHFSEKDGTMVFVAVDEKCAGAVVIGDEIHPKAQTAVLRLRKMGVETIMMLTGDNQSAAKSVAERLGLDGYLAGLLPDQKVEAFERIMENAKSSGRQTGRTAFVGDGVNDAPVIARADVGAAMGALGSDAAIESADVVLMSDSPERMADAVAMSKHTRVIVWENIIFALVVKVAFISLGVFGMATMWMAVFADVGTALLAVVNSMRVMGGVPDA
ncbi:MAG: cadmium-translocating P-type ATPase [Deltaproteobacteria bacterium]|nr:cadmium-translocating P-type ATPase [Deltaproteobacteria bacterium]